MSEIDTKKKVVVELDDQTYKFYQDIANQQTQGINTIEGHLELSLVLLRSIMINPTSYSKVFVEEGKVCKQSHTK